MNQIQNEQSEDAKAVYPSGLSTAVISEIKNMSPNHFGNQLPTSSEDDKIIKLDKTKKQKSTPRGKNGNLDQAQIDNPMLKDHKAVIITEFMMLSDERCSMDPGFIDQNKVTHIINAAGDVIHNVFDPMLVNDSAVKELIKQEGLTSCKLFGKIQYYTIKTWSEHKLQLNPKECRAIFEFIEDAVQRYSSCLIVSQRNKCCTVVIAIVYLIQKFKWDVHRCLEYINARKADVEITVTILKQLQKFEEQFKQEIVKVEEPYSLRDNWRIEFDIFNPLNDKFYNQFNRLKSNEISLDKFVGISSSNGQGDSGSTNQRKKEKYYLQETYVQVEDEAAMINQHLNSLKQDQTRKKNQSTKERQNLYKQSTENTNDNSNQAAPKSMKQMIAESIKENNNRKEALKKTLNFNALQSKKLPKVIEQKKLARFNAQHYNKNGKLNYKIQSNKTRPNQTSSSRLLDVYDSPKNIGEDDFKKREKSHPTNLTGSPIGKSDRHKYSDSPARNKTEPSNLIDKSQFARLREQSFTGSTLKIPLISRQEESSGQSMTSEPIMQTGYNSPPNMKELNEIDHNRQMARTQQWEEPKQNVAYTERVQSSNAVSKNIQKGPLLTIKKQDIMMASQYSTPQQPGRQWNESNELEDQIIQNNMNIRNQPKQQHQETQQKIAKNHSESKGKSNQMSRNRGEYMESIMDNAFVPRTEEKKVNKLELNQIGAPKEITSNQINKMKAFEYNESKITTKQQDMYANYKPLEPKQAAPKTDMNDLIRQQKEQKARMLKRKQLQQQQLEKQQKTRQNQEQQIIQTNYYGIQPASRTAQNSPVNQPQQLINQSQSAQKQMRTNANSPINMISVKRPVSRGDRVQNQQNTLKNVQSARNVQMRENNGLKLPNIETQLKLPGLTGNNSQRTIQQPVTLVDSFGNKEGNSNRSISQMARQQKQEILQLTNQHKLSQINQIDPYGQHKLPSSDLEGQRLLMNKTLADKNRKMQNIKIQSDFGKPQNSLNKNTIIKPIVLKKSEEVKVQEITRQPTKPQEPPRELTAAEKMQATLDKMTKQMDKNTAQREADAIEAKKNQKPSNARKFTKGQIAQHNTLTDCWIILDAKVYDVTSYIYEHPGGSTKLMQCSGTGKDYIEDFEAEEHSKAAINKLKKFYIGDVK